jgi:protein-S-isoprenylcysteine O-methyltransferase Ste14
VAWEIIQIVACWTGFALVHSLTASERYERWLRQRTGDRVFDSFHRLAYTIVSFATFALLVAFLRSLADQPLYSIPPPWRLALRGGQLAGFLFLLRTPVRLSEFLGLRQAMAYPGDQRPDMPEMLYTGKTYAIVRHPLYLGCIAIIACQPDQTLVSGVSSLMAILYFYIGTFHEESRLANRFGDDYRMYQRQIPRLFPWPRRPDSRK